MDPVEKMLIGMNLKTRLSFQKKKKKKKKQILNLTIIKTPGNLEVQYPEF